MLRAINVRFRYGRQSPWVLDGISLDIAAGEIVGLSGRSGAGKSTLARILAGYLHPTAGAVEADGGATPVSGCCPVQMVFQNPELAINPFFRIRKVLSEATAELGDLPDVFGIEATWLSRFSHELSGGELQRIALARALGTRCRFLIADEATAMLDPIAQVQIWHGIGRIADARNLGVLAISHDAALLQRIARRVVKLGG